MKVLDQHKENKIKHKKLLQNLKNTLADVTEVQNKFCQQLS